MFREHYVNSFWSVETNAKANRVILRDHAGPVLRMRQSDFILPHETFPIKICSLVNTPFF